MRQALAVVAGAGAAVLGALVLGEYEFSGVLPLVMGVLLGLAVTEVTTWIGRGATPVSTVAAAALTAGGLLAAGCISVHHRHDATPVGAWAAAALGPRTAEARTESARG